MSCLRCWEVLQSRPPKRCSRKGVVRAAAVRNVRLTWTNRPSSDLGDSSIAYGNFRAHTTAHLQHEGSIPAVGAGCVCSVQVVLGAMALLTWVLRRACNTKGFTNVEYHRIARRYNSTGRRHQGPKEILQTRMEMQLVWRRILSLVLGYGTVRMV